MTTNALNGVAYNDGKFVVVGNNGTLLESADTRVILANVAPTSTNTLRFRTGWAAGMEWARVNDDKTWIARQAQLLTVQLRSGSATDAQQWP